MTGRPRPLAAADLPRLTELELALFGPGAWSRAMLAEELGGPGRWYVGVDLAVGVDPEGVEPEGVDPAEGAGADGPERRLVGYAGLWFDGEVTQVMTLAVALEAQRRGVGRALLTALVDRSRELGARALLLEVQVDNEPALALYRRAGFEILGRRPRYYQPQDVDAWTMQLDLAAPRG